MKRFMIPAFALLAAASIALAAEVKSGLAIGEATSAFNVKDITGPNKGTSLCYRCQYGARPVACVFTRSITDEVAGLIQQIDAKVEANKEKDMHGFVVLLADDADAAGKQLAKLAEEKHIKNLPLTVYEGKAGPEEYKLSKDAAVTVLMWNKGRVQVNHAYGTANLAADDVKQITGDTSKILD
jgi:hypothetical protein